MITGKLGKKLFLSSLILFIGVIPFFSYSCSASSNTEQPNDQDQKRLEEIIEKNLIISLNSNSIEDELITSQNKYFYPYLIAKNNKKIDSNFFLFSDNQNDLNINYRLVDTRDFNSDFFTLNLEAKIEGKNFWYSFEKLIDKTTFFTSNQTYSSNLISSLELSSNYVDKINKKFFYDELLINNNDKILVHDKKFLDAQIIYNQPEEAFLLDANDKKVKLNISILLLNEEVKKTVDLELKLQTYPRKIWFIPIDKEGKLITAGLPNSNPILSSELFLINYHKKIQKLIINIDFKNRGIFGKLDFSTFDEWEIINSNSFSGNAITELILPQKVVEIPNNFFRDNLIEEVNFNNLPYILYKNSFDLTINSSNHPSYKGVNIINFDNVKLANTNDSKLILNLASYYNGSNLDLSSLNNYEDFFNILLFFKDKKINTLILSGHKDVLFDSQKNEELAKLNISIENLKIKGYNKDGIITNEFIMPSFYYDSNNKWKINNILIEESIISFRFLDFDKVKKNFNSFSNINRKIGDDIKELISNKIIDLFSSKVINFKYKNIKSEDVGLDIKNLSYYFDYFDYFNIEKNQKEKLIDEIHLIKTNNIIFDEIEEKHLININSEKEYKILNFFGGNKKIIINKFQNVNLTLNTINDYKNKGINLKRTFDHLTNINAILDGTILDLSDISDEKKLEYFWKKISLIDNTFTEIKLNPNIKKIPNYIFSNLDLSKVTFDFSIYPYLEEIGNSSFENTKIKEIKNLPTIINQSAFKNAIFIVKNISGNKTKEISNSAFDSTNLEETLFPNLEIIGSNAFSGCSSLIQIDLPNITSIGSYAFSSCSKLVTINLGSQLTKIENNTFYNCSQLKNINLENITSIGSNAFYNCSKLETVNLNNQLTKIENNTFYNCSQLKNINLENITSIGSNAFYNCSSLIKIDLPNIISIGSSAFSSCSSLVTVNLNPQEKVTIESNAFTKTNLVIINLKYNDIFKIDSFDLKTAKEINNKDKIDIFKYVEISGEYITLNFANEIGIIEITNDKKFKEILNQFYFLDISKEINVIFPQNPNIYQNDILGTNLTNFLKNNTIKFNQIVLPSTIVKIDDNAFENIKINSIIIPEKNSLKIIGKKAFYNCGLSYFDFLKGKIEILEENSFSGNNFSKLDFSNTKVTTIEKQSFKNNYDLIEVNISKNVKKVAIDAFDNWNYVKRELDAEFHENGISFAKYYKKEEKFLDLSDLKNNNQLSEKTFLFEYWNQVMGAEIKRIKLPNFMNFLYFDRGDTGKWNFNQLGNFDVLDLNNIVIIYNDGNAENLKIEKIINNSNSLIKSFDKEIEDKINNSLYKKML
ncbi:MAG: leucine-rich repeat protein [Metamycoplasmataceae bacterium]